MNSMSRHAELQRKSKEVDNLGCDMMVETVMAVCQGHWIIDGACDPSRHCELMQKALLERDEQKIASLTDSLAEAVFRAHRVGDFVPANDNERQFIARAEACVEKHYDECLDFGSLAA